MERATIGYAMCGSFCTFAKSIDTLKQLVEKGYKVLPIMSENAYATDTRFGAAKDIIAQVENITANKVIHTITEAEPIGPKKMCDVIVINPCTGNTLAKLASGITDTAVTMAVKSHLRVQRPILIALSSNDALGANAANIGTLINRKHIYFVPMERDDPINKPNSLTALQSEVLPSLEKVINRTCKR